MLVIGDTAVNSLSLLEFLHQCAFLWRSTRDTKREIHGSVPESGTQGKAVRMGGDDCVRPGGGEDLSGKVMLTSGLRAVGHREGGGAWEWWGA